MKVWEVRVWASNTWKSDYFPPSLCHYQNVASEKKPQNFLVAFLKKRLRKAESWNGRRERDGLWLLDLFLWLHHVVVKGSKGDSFFFFFIQSLDRQKTPVRLPDNRHLKQREKGRPEVKYDGGHCLFNGRTICDDIVRMTERILCLTLWKISQCWMHFVDVMSGQTISIQKFIWNLYEKTLYFKTEQYTYYYYFMYIFYII